MAAMNGVVAERGAFVHGNPRPMIGHIDRELLHSPRRSVAPPPSARSNAARPYSARRVAAGSIRAAWRAGSQEAMIPVRERSAATTAKVTGSLGVTP